MISAQRIADTVVRTMSGRRARLFVFWCHVVRDRSAMRDDLAKILENSAVVALVLRRARFLTPNAVLSDLLELIEENQDEFSKVSPYPSDAPVGIILLSRSQLDLPQWSSPVIMPQWMPRLGGQEVYATIEDLTYKGITAPFNDPELMDWGLNASLYDLESALVDRLLATSKDKKSCGDSLWASLRREDEELSYGAFLCAARKYLDSVASPTAYRPSARLDESFSSRVIRLCSKRSPEQLGKIAKALAAALVVAEQEYAFPTPPVVAFLYRPTTPDPTTARRWVRGIIVALYAAAQVCNAAAHAHEYPEYPYLYLRYILDDITTYLAESAAALRRLS